VVTAGNMVRLLNPYQRKYQIVHVDRRYLNVAFVEHSEILQLQSVKHIFGKLICLFMHLGLTV
jgi:hypothetical protein